MSNGLEIEEAVVDEASSSTPTEVTESKETSPPTVDAQDSITDSKPKKDPSKRGWLHQSACFADGYWAMGSNPGNPLNLSQLDALIQGWIRPFCDSIVSVEIPRLISQFALSTSDDIVQLESGGSVPLYFLIPKSTIELSAKLSKLCESNPVKVTLDKIPGETLDHVCRYLCHHNGKEPDPLPCPVRSIHMAQIVSDKWDATWIDAFDKKTIFEIILASNELEIKSLTHLGCAKIATLIKQLDQSEINRIIEEEERYRREHPQEQQQVQPARSGDDDDDDDDDDDENVDDDAEDEVDEMSDLEDAEDNNIEDQNDGGGDVVDGVDIFGSADFEDEDDDNDIGDMMRQLSNGPRVLTRRLSASIIEMTQSMELSDDGQNEE